MLHHRKFATKSRMGAIPTLRIRDLEMRRENVNPTICRSCLFSRPYIDRPLATDLIDDIFFDVAEHLPRLRILPASSAFDPWM